MFVISLPRCLLLALLLLLAPGVAHAGLVWTPETGWINPDSTVVATAEEIYAQANKAYDAKAYADASIGYHELIRAYPTSDEARRCLLKLMEAQYLAEDFEGSLGTIELIMGLKPSADVILKVQQRRYDIGYAYLNGVRYHILGIPISGKGRGRDLLKSVSDQHPFLPFSDDALFHLATVYFNDKDFEEAESIYNRIVRVYPQREWAGIAEYQIGQSALMRLKGVEYDFSLVDKAERSFQGYLRRYPRGDKREDALKQLRTIGALRAEKLLGIARFYLQEERIKAARYYLQKIRTDFPDTESALQARELLQKGEVSK